MTTHIDVDPRKIAAVVYEEAGRRLGAAWEAEPDWREIAPIRW